MNDHWEHFEHGADIGAHGVGASKAGASSRRLWR
jgi:SHS2 domain-containing protein